MSLDMTVGRCAGNSSRAVPISRKDGRAGCVWGWAISRWASKSTTLSGGEAQRRKTCPRNWPGDARPTRSFYILEASRQPPAFRDVRKLFGVLHELVMQAKLGRVIEHYLDVVQNRPMASSNRPEGGVAAAKLVAFRHPRKVAEEPAQHTGHYLKPCWQRKVAASRRPDDSPASAP